MGDHIKPQTDHMNGTEVTCQAVFEDLDWSPIVLETDAEKQAKWEKNSEWMVENAEPDKMMAEEKAVAKSRERGIWHKNMCGNTEL
jgi:hypothetical protein